MNRGKGLSDIVRSVGTGLATRASHEDEGVSCPYAPFLFLYTICLYSSGRYH
jgi:hypothetical protein